MNFLPWDVIKDGNVCLPLAPKWIFGYYQCTESRFDIGLRLVQKRRPGGSRHRCLLFTRSGLCNHSFSHIYATFCSMSILRVISSVSSTWFYLRSIIQTQPSLSFTHIYRVFYTNAVLQSTKDLCYITVTVFATCQEPQPVEGIKLSEDFSSFTLSTFWHVSFTF